jgi:hypothetical protein
MPEKCKLVRKGNKCMQKCEEDGKPVEKDVPMKYCDEEGI